MDMKLWENKAFDYKVFIFNTLILRLNKKVPGLFWEARDSEVAIGLYGECL